MANLAETDIWADGIYQIETVDSVVGGPDGIANMQAKQLGARTKYLKKRLDELSDAIGQELGTSANYKAVTVYDTAKDSDGGAWRERCQGLSWYTEARPAGRYLGRYADRAACIAANADWTANDWYSRTGSTAFYQLTAVSETQIYRAGSAKFPALALIVADNAAVTIYDLTQPSAPMWAHYPATAYSFPGTSAKSSLVALDGMVLAGTTVGLSFMEFLTDRCGNYNATGGKNYSVNNVANARIAQTAWAVSDTAKLLVNSTVNAVAITVRPDAPIDAATGLPVPTIAAGTEGGVSVIRHDGTAVSITNTNRPYTGWVGFPSHGGIAFGSSNVAGAKPYDIQFYREIPAASVSNAAPYDYHFLGSTYTPAGYPATDPLYGFPAGPIVASPHTLVLGKTNVNSLLGITLLRNNPATPAAGMVAHITNAIPGLWQPGDIRGAWLADTVAETLTGAELATEGGFASVATWTFGAGWSHDAVNSEADAAAASADLVETMALSAGKPYVVVFTVKNFTGGTLTPKLGTQAGTAVSANGTYAQTIVANGNNLTFTGAAFSGSIDDVSVRLAVANRSVKQKGLQVYGALTKPAVASGAQMVGYSGFSDANYLEQPYNADLDFGTGDFYAVWWQKADYGTVLDRADSDLSDRFRIRTGSGDLLNVNFKEAQFSSTRNVMDGLLHCVVVQRVSGVLQIHVDGTLDAIHVGTSISNFSFTGDGTAKLRVGYSLDGNSNALSGAGHFLALLRTGVGALSKDQIEHIYATERKLFEAGAKCTLDGTSNTINALAYDQDTNLLHAGTAWGRSTFDGLCRVESEAATVGALVALSASGGALGTVGASGGKIKAPAIGLREKAAYASADKLNREMTQLFWFDDLIQSGDCASTTNFSVTNATQAVVSGAIRVTATAASPVWRYTPAIKTVPGRRYKLTVDILNHASGKTLTVGVGTAAGGSQLGSVTTTAAATKTVTFTALTTTTYVSVTGDATFTTETFDVDNLRAHEADAASNEVYALPAGWKPKRLLIDGVGKREGAAKDYTVLATGFRKLVKPAVLPAIGANICVEAVLEVVSMVRGAG